MSAGGIDGGGERRATTKLVRREREAGEKVEQRLLGN